MTTLEKKVDVLLRAVAGEDEETRQKALEEAKNFIGEPTVSMSYADTIRQVVEDMLFEVGAIANLRGYATLVEGIILCVENPAMINVITKELYPEIAKRLGDDRTPSRVERAMRHSIEVIFDRCDIDTLRKYFGNAVSLQKDKPTNSEFVARMAYEVRRRMA